ncbi:hypothetical protein [Agriterribacter sp.]|uniref:hypothetical protein n=1 Tax=Agriterribacter sp. TaxID=2821509 RepID=UPI002CF69798|nr:hypothetical protein [Agriterribacter sp.]HRP55783.1 hypothetical protein [Agriterribacter sp.]
MNFRKLLPALFLTNALLATAIAQEKTAFQTAHHWIPEIDVRSDIAIVYGVSERGKMSFEERVKSWRDRGYQTHFMTGIAWGQYDDYFLGRWDGKDHLGEGQQTVNGDTIWHGRNIPYVVPVASFIAYMKERVIKRVIDAGISSIYLEEPEFWARAGYSEVFKKEWQSYYGFPWRPQHESPENTYLSGKLKYHLYYHAIDQVSAYAKEYGKTKGMDVKVYIPTHSLVNYSSWQIVSPEASLASLPGIDGYIAQVWTGTSREPTYFNGLEKERVFENAFLEYGSMVSMTAPTNRKLFFLTDPIEDWPRDWADYKKNYEATFTAQLLYPMVANYEVMPWPERIYTRPYKLASSDEKVLIPKYYSTQMQVMVNALNNIQVTHHKITGSGGIGILMGNSLMFQRFPVHNGFEDPQFSNFYGQTLPLVKRGIPVQTVHMENLAYAATLKDIKVLVMSYSNMKPVSADVHRHLADWVKQGGVLVYCGRDDDPYQAVMEWWNTGGNRYPAPSRHLFELLQVKPTGNNQEAAVGKGKVYVLRQNPKAFVIAANGDENYMNIIKKAWQTDAKAGELQLKNNFYLQRGPYDIVSVMDESISEQPYTVNGLLIDLFDPELPVLQKKVVQPGSQAFLYNLSRIKNKKQPQVLASACRVYNEKTGAGSYAFICKSPLNTINRMRILLPAAPEKTSVTDDKGAALTGIKKEWDAASRTLLLGFNNSPEGINVEISW